MLRPLASRLLLMAGVAGFACGGSPAKPFEVSLARVAEGADGAILTDADGTRIVQTDERPVDAYVRIPASAALRFDLAPNAPADGFSVTVTEDGREEVLRVERSGRDPGAWRADLSDRAGEIVRIRLENLTGGRLTWLDPRIVGVPEPFPALLPERARPTTPPNVLLYLIDTLRADHLSAYGYQRRTSPRIDELAARSTVFEHAYAASTHSRGSVSALFTSLPPSEAMPGLRKGAGSAVTLAEAFHRAGYATAGFQANHWLKKYLGFGRGFDEYLVFAPPVDHPYGKVPAAEIHEQVIAWIDSHPARPFFLYVQTLGAHEPYEPPAPFRGRFHDADAPTTHAALNPPEGLSGRRLDWFRRLALATDPDAYDEAIAYADAQLGHLLDELGDRGLLDSTIVIVIADHGESLGEGGRYLHGTSTTEEQLHVPWILSEPGQVAGHRVPDPVSLLDLAPTVLDRAGVPVPSGFSGRRLGRVQPVREAGAVFGELTKTPFLPHREWFLRDGPWKLVSDGESFELFHLPTDALEERDVSGEHPVRTRYLARILRKRSPSLRSGGVAPSPDAGLGEEERADIEKSLRALGYIE